jgi:membrane-bound serine protease (ClpP class)
VTVLGIVFVVLAAAFFLAELEMPGVGVAAAAGTLSLLLGIMFLIDDLPSVRVRVAVAIPTVAAVTATALLAGNIARRRSAQPSAMTGPARLIGEIGTVRTDPGGPQAFIVGAWWSIRPQLLDTAFQDGLLVRVVAVDGLTLVVDVPSLPALASGSPDQGDHP